MLPEKRAGDISKITFSEPLNAEPIGVCHTIFMAYSTNKKTIGILLSIHPPKTILYFFKIYLS